MQVLLYMPLIAALNNDFFTWVFTKISSCIEQGRPPGAMVDLDVK